MSLNIYESRPRVIRQNVDRCLAAGLVPFITSAPGAGKSSLVHAIAKAYKLQLIDIRLSMADPTDMSGLPVFDHVTGRARFMPFDMFPVAGTPLPDGMDGWLILLDELPSASRAVMAASYKLILDRCIGMNPLHENVCLVAAGNRMQDKAIVNPMGTAMQSRLVHLEMGVNFEDWLRDVALPQNYDSRIIGFLSMYEHHLMDFNPNHQDKTYSCPRTWEFVNRLVKVDGVELPITVEDAPLLAGTITSGVATDFIQYVTLAGELVSLADVLSDPDTAKIPTEVSAQWATVTRLIGAADDGNLTPIMKYLERYQMPMRVLAARSAYAKNAKWAQHPGMRQANVALAKYLWND